MYLLWCTKTGMVWVLTSFINQVWGGITLCYSYLNKYHFSGNLPKLSFSTITCGSDHQVPFGFGLNWFECGPRTEIWFLHMFDIHLTLEKAWRCYCGYEPAVRSHSACHLPERAPGKAWCSGANVRSQGRNHRQPGAYWVSVTRSEDERPERRMKRIPSRGPAHFHKK